MTTPNKPSLLEQGQAMQSVLTDLSTVTVSHVVSFFRQNQDRPDFADVLNQAYPQLIEPQVHGAALVGAQVYNEIDPTSDFTAAPIVDLRPEQLDNTVDWALNAPGQATPLDRLAGSAKRSVFDGARSTIVGNAAQEGVKYVRLAAPDACAFCRLLATRTSGADGLYTSEQSALNVVGRGGRTRGTRPLGEKYHDHCRCVAVPVRGKQAYQPPSYVRDWEAQYRAARNSGARTTQEILAEMRKRDGGDTVGRLGSDKSTPPSAPKPPVTELDKPAAPKTNVDGETRADVARRHLPVLEENLQRMRDEGMAEDSPPIVYHRQQVERLRRDAGHEALPTAGGGGGDKPPPPPVHNGPIGAEDDPQGRMNRLFADQTSAADDGRRASAERWQGFGRYYEQVQTAVQDPNAPNSEATKVALDMQDMAVPLPEGVQVWRGVRDVEAQFGTSMDRLSDAPDTITERFVSTTVHEQVARDEFLQPGPNPALIKVIARAGADVVWIPPIGDPQMAYQGELLFTPGHLVRILSVDTSGTLPVIEVEVSQP